MPSISSIAIIIKANTKPYLKGLKRAIRGTLKFTNSLKELSLEIAKYGAALLALTLGALTLFLKKQFAIIDAVKKTGRALGLTVDFIEGMKFAGTQLGVSQEKIIKSLKRFTRTMGEAQLGFGTGQTAFQAWGKSIKDFQELDVEKSFISVSKELRKIKDPTKQAAIAFQFFGRNGIEMLNIINENKDSIVGFLKESKRLKGAFGDMDVRQVEAANDAVDKMGSALDGIGKQLAFTIAPAVRVAFHEFTEALILVRKWFERNEDAVKSFIRQVVSLAGPILLQLKSNFVAVFSVITGLFGKAGPLSMDIFKTKILGFFIDIEFATRNWGKVWEIVALEIETVLQRLEGAGIKFKDSWLKSILIVKRAFERMTEDFKVVDTFVTLISPFSALDPAGAAAKATKTLNRLDKEMQASKLDFQKKMNQFGIDNAKRILKINANAVKVKNMKDLITAKKLALLEGRKEFKKGKIASIEKDMVDLLKRLDDLLLNFGKPRITEPLTRPLEKIDLPSLAVKGSQAAVSIGNAAELERTVLQKQLNEQIETNKLLEKIRIAEEKRAFAQAVADQVLGTIQPFVGATL